MLSVSQRYRRRSLHDLKMPRVYLTTPVGGVERGGFAAVVLTQRCQKSFKPLDELTCVDVWRMPMRMPLEETRAVLSLKKV